MCNKLTKKQIDAKFRKKRKRDGSFAAWLTDSEVIPNVCGAMMDGKKMASHWIGNEKCRRRFTPCRIKGVHPITNAPVNTHLHHINQDGSDDRKCNLVRLCPYCHDYIHLLLGRVNCYTKPNFIKWFLKNCTNPRSFVDMTAAKLVPDFIPKRPDIVYGRTNEWFGWEEFVDPAYYMNHRPVRPDRKAKIRAMRRKPNSAKQHFALMAKHKIINRRQWDKLIASMGGFKECGYLRSPYFLSYYRDEWIKWNDGEEYIRFHYIPKKERGG